MPTALPGMWEAEAAVSCSHGPRAEELPGGGARVRQSRARETPTDPAPLEMFETVVLKPRSEWPAGVTWDALIEKMDAALQVPRHAERLVDADPDPHGDAGHRRSQSLGHPGLRRRPGRVDRVARRRDRAGAVQVPGTRSAFAERSTGGFYIDFDVNREPPRATASTSRT